MAFDLTQFLTNVVVGLRERLADKLQVKTFSSNLSAGTGPRWGIEQNGNATYAVFADLEETDLKRIEQVKPGNVLKLPPDNQGNKRELTAVSEWDKTNKRFEVDKPISAKIDGIAYELSLCNVKIVKAYPTNDIEINDLPVPAVLVDLFEMMPMSPNDPDYNMASLTGRLGVTLMMTAYVVVGSCEPQANLKIRELALRVATEINALRRFGIQECSPAQILSIANQRDISHENQVFFAWSVEWSHDVIVGAESTAACPDPSVDAEDIKTVHVSVVYP